MTWEEYVEKAKSTAGYKTEKELVTCCVLGIIEEYQEYYEAMDKYHGGESSLNSIKAELGDLSWYLAVLTDHFNYTPVPTGEMFWLEEHVGMLAKTFKKAIRDNNWVMPPDRWDNFTFLMDSLAVFIEDSAQGWDWTVEEVLQYNVNKLADRMKRNVIGGDGDNR